MTTLRRARKVCSWCEKVLQEGIPADIRVTTHGLCPACKRKLEAELPPESCAICAMCSDPLVNPSATLCDFCNVTWGDGRYEEV